MDNVVLDLNSWKIWYDNFMSWTIVFENLISWTIWFESSISIYPVVLKAHKPLQCGFRAQVLGQWV